MSNGPDQPPPRVTRVIPPRPNVRSKRPSAVKRATIASACAVVVRIASVATVMRPSGPMSASGIWVFLAGTQATPSAPNRVSIEPSGAKRTTPAMDSPRIVP